MFNLLFIFCQIALRTNKQRRYLIKRITSQKTINETLLKVYICCHLLVECHYSTQLSRTTACVCVCVCGCSFHGVAKFTLSAFIYNAYIIQLCTKGQLHFNDALTALPSLYQLKLL